MLMKDKRWLVWFGAGLVALAAALHVMHFLIFRDAHHILIYLLGDIAFVPVEVLLVTLVLHQVLGRWEKRGRLHKLNMVIGAFFSEVGAGLLRRMRGLDCTDQIPPELRVHKEWSAKDYAVAVRFAALMKPSITLNSESASQLREFLLQHRTFLLRLLENPYLLEHEVFTDLLWAVLHLTEELAARTDLRALPDSDLKHLSGDAERAYGRLLCQWLAYMNHLRSDYPYLYSLAIRLSPLDDEASPVVQQ